MPKQEDSIPRCTNIHGLNSRDESRAMTFVMEISNQLKSKHMKQREGMRLKMRRRKGREENGREGKARHGKARQKGTISILGAFFNTVSVQLGKKLRN